MFRERTKHTRLEQTDLELLAAYFGLPGGIRVCQRLQLQPDGSLADMFPAGTMLLFVDGTAPSGTMGASTDSNQPIFVQQPGISRSTATFAQTYVLNGGLRVGAERIDEDNDTFVHTVRFDGAIVLPSIGPNMLASAGFLASALI